MRTIYLVQRGHVDLKTLATLADPAAEKSELLSLRLSRVVNFDYMASAEFEWGALPKSFRGLQAARSTWKVIEVDSISDENENPLYVFTGLTGPAYDAWFADLQRLRYGRPGSKEYLQTKEYTDFRKDDTRARSRPTNFWWDIENHAMFSFSKPFMDNIQQFVSNSLAYMDSQQK